MKLVLKTITGKQQEVEVEASATVLDVKKIVEEEYEPASLRLFYNGAILEDTKTVTECGVKGGESLVVAGRKRKISKPAPHPPAEAPMAEAPAPAPQIAPASSAPAVVDAGALPSSLVDVPVPPGAAASTVVPTTANTDPAPASSFLASAAPSATASVAAPAAPASDPHGAPANLIDEVCSMGFEDRQQVALALRAAYMNVDRAVEYLFDGIPPHRIQEMTRDTNSAAPAPPSSDAGVSAAAVPSTATTATAPAPPTAESELRAALAGIPQFDQIRALYVQNTETLPLVTQQIALRHPAVYEQIERHPEAFLAIMSESGGPGATATPAAPSQSGGAPSTAHGTAPAGARGLMDEMPADLELTAQDRLAVQQLVELGGGMWDEQGALLVYLATQRNQEVAASILFEHGGVPPELLAEIANQMAEEDAYEDDDEQQ